jgi:hypothetical protein
MKLNHWLRRLAAMGALALATTGAPAETPGGGEFEVSTSNLLVVLRETPGANKQEESLTPFGRISARAADGREFEFEASWFQYLGDMHLRLVFDGARRVQSALPEDLQKLRLSPEEALAHAVDNLRRRYGEPVAQPWSGGLMQVHGNAPELDSSYFLDRGFWLEQLRHSPAGIVAAVRAAAASCSPARTTTRRWPACASAPPRCTRATMPRGSPPASTCSRTAAGPCSSRRSRRPTKARTAAPPRGSRRPAAATAPPSPPSRRDAREGVGGGSVRHQEQVAALGHASGDLLQLADLPGLGFAAAVEVAERRLQLARAAEHEACGLLAAAPGAGLQPRHRDGAAAQGLPEARASERPPRLRLRWVLQSSSFMPGGSPTPGSVVPCRTSTTCRPSAAATTGLRPPAAPAAPARARTSSNRRRVVRTMGSSRAAAVDPHATLSA